MPSPVISTTLAPAFKGFNAKFNEQFAATNPLWPQLAMRTESTGTSETYGWMQEIPGVREWVGSRVRHTTKLNDLTIINKKWELTIEIDEDSVDDDKLSIFDKRAALTGANAAVAPDLLVLNDLVDGFTKNGYDGTTFFSASHTWKGRTVSNLTSNALDASNFALAKQAFLQNLGNAGANGEAPLNINPEFLLVVGPALESTARSIIKMERVNGGDSNVNMNAADLLVLPYLTNNTGAAGTVQAANYWYLICTNTPGGLMPFIYQVRRDWRTREITDGQEWIVFDSGQYVWGVDARYNTGYGLWQLAYGSNAT